MKYRKKPVVIEAFQYNGYFTDQNGVPYMPEWAVKALKNNIMYYGSVGSGPPCELFIATLEGVHHVSIGDYIIQGVQGEMYPCKPDIFEKTYEDWHETTEEQIDRLSRFIIANCSGEPSRSESAVDTAIRLLGKGVTHDQRIL